MLTSIGGLVPFLPLFILHALAFPASQSSSGPKQGHTPRLLLPEATKVPITNKVEIRADPTVPQGASSSRLPATSSTDIFTDPGCSSVSFVWSFCNAGNPGVLTLQLIISKPHACAMANSTLRPRPRLAPSLYQRPFPKV
jgi:hypothetical protein